MLTNLCAVVDAFEVPASSHSALTQPSFLGSPLCVHSVYAARNVWGAHLSLSTALLSSGSSSKAPGLFLLGQSQDNIREAELWVFSIPSQLAVPH